MTDARVSRAHAEALIEPNPTEQVSRVHADVLVLPTPDAQVAAVALEVLVLEGAEANLVATLPAFTAQGTGTAAPPGRGANLVATLPAFRSSASGTAAAPPRTGALEATLPAFTAEASGTTTPLRTGQLAATMPAFAADVEGTTAGIPTHNDAFADATPIILTSGRFVSGLAATTEATTEDGEPPVGVTGPFKTAWWTFTPATADPVTISLETRAASPTGATAVFALYAGTTLDTLTLIAAADTSDPDAPPLPRIEDLPLEVDTTYYLQVGAGNPDDDVQYVLTVTAAGLVPARTDTSNRTNGRTRMGSGESLTVYPVAPLPHYLSAEPIRVTAQRMPLPKLVDGVPL